MTGSKGSILIGGASYSVCILFGGGDHIFERGYDVEPTHGCAKEVPKEVSKIFPKRFKIGFQRGLKEVPREV